MTHPLLAESSKSIRGMSGTMATMEKMMPDIDDITFWTIVNVILFLFVGIFQLAYGLGPGIALSAGAILISILYLLLWMWGKTNKKTAHMLIMWVSGLAVLGDLIVIAWLYYGRFTGTSALLDFAGIMLFRAAYMEYRTPK